jgi:deoxyribodipyrimidine photo-lyase
MKHKKTLFIFRRDLRLDDNTALIQALRESEKVIPCFIFDPRQTGRNSYKSENCLQFIIESLQDLEKQLNAQGGRLYLFKGIAENVVRKLVEKEKIDAVYVNRDYTPFSKRRDEVIKKNAPRFYSYDDYLLNAPEKTLKKDGKPYSIFTPYYKNASKIPVKKPIKNRNSNYHTRKINFEIKNHNGIIKQANENIHVHGGRKNCLQILKNIDKLKNYETTHDYPSKQTTNLSAHNKIGTCSIREVYWKIHDKLGWQSPILRQLYWRDFFTQLAHYYPRVFGRSFNKKYDKIRWNYDKKKFKAWCEGKTGIPIVDAGMRQLNKTGFMHNRIRMIAAQFLTKDLHIDWRWGEKYFAKKLVDYDPCVNNGNWQWCASTGADAQPWFRIFNPWTQQKKFDPKCAYIKQWVEELRNIDPFVIHILNTERIKGYPAPIVNHEEERKKSLSIYKRV